MKGKSLLVLIPALAFVILANAACSASKLNPRSAAGLARAKSEGSLKVYSAQGWDSGNEGSASYVHSDYKILTPDGRLFMNEPNVSPSGGGDPVAVAVPAGNYVVVTQARGRGTVREPVTIEPGRMTVLHLNDARDGRHAKKP